MKWFFFTAIICSLYACIEERPEKNQLHIKDNQAQDLPEISIGTEQQSDSISLFHRVKETKEKEKNDLVKEQETRNKSYRRLPSSFLSGNKDI